MTKLGCQRRAFTGRFVVVAMLALAASTLGSAMGNAATAAAQEYRYRESMYPLLPKEFPADSRRIQLAFLGYFGFAGKLQADSSVVAGSVDLDPTLGFNGRLTIPVHPLFAVGTQIGLLFWQTDNTGSSSNKLLDADAYFKLRYPFFLRGLASGEVYLGLPVGFSASFVDDRNGLEYNTGLGWNIGLMPGVQFLFGRRVGVIGELGWMMHSFSQDVTSVDVKTNYDAHFHQVVMQLGFVVLLGSR